MGRTARQTYRTREDAYDATYSSRSKLDFPSCNLIMNRAFSIADADDVICAILRGESPSCPSEFGHDFAKMFLRRAVYHGVFALLHERSALHAWPFSIRAPIRDHTIAQAFWELRHEKLLCEVLAALCAKGVEPVLFKGTALAYNLYANPVWRARGDTDMIVSIGDCSRTVDSLVSLGFRRGDSAGGELTSYQENYIFTLRDQTSHTIDLHRRINNSQLLSLLFTYSELRAGAVGLQRLCEGALAAGIEHALLLACMHRATHRHNPYFVDGTTHYGGDRLIWLYDIYLLARSFTVRNWREVVRLASSKGLCATTLDGLERAAARFGQCCPDDVRYQFARTGESAALYLGAGRLRQSWIDFCAIEGSKKRLRFLRELVFPPSSYMRAKYGTIHPALLPLRYGHRAVTGAMKRLQRDG
jgi:hypothetical protein